MDIRKIIVAGFSLFVSSAAHAVLLNTDRAVTQVDVMQTTAIIWVDGSALMNQPAACSSFKAVSCPLGGKFCDSMIAVALSAKLAGKNVEFDFSGACNGVFGDAARFRMMN